MESAIPVIPVQINSFSFFAYYIVVLKKKKNTRIFLSVFKHSLCECCENCLKIVVVLQNREHQYGEMN